MIARVAIAVLLLLPVQSPTAPKKGGNPEAAKLTNPVAATSEAVGAGRRVYTRMCSRCHGAEGKGDGPAATGNVPDLTDPHWDFGGSDGEIFSVIHDGVSADMDGYAARLSDTDIWNVVSYLKTLSPKR